PDRQLVAVGIGEMEAAAAGEIVGWFHDASAGRLDAALQVRQIVGVEDDERAAGAARLALREAAGQPAVGELAIVGAVILERPAEGRAVEPLGARHIGDVELDIVDAAVVRGIGLRHVSPPGEAEILARARSGVLNETATLSIPLPLREG